MTLSQYEAEVLRQLERQFSDTGRGSALKLRRTAVVATFITGLALVGNGLALLALQTGPTGWVAAAIVMGTVLVTALAVGYHLQRRQRQQWREP